MKLKQWGSLLLTCVLSVSLIAGCSSNGSEGSEADPDAKMNETGFPIVNDKITVTGFAGKFFANADWNNIKIWQEYEKMTNVHVQWDTVHTDSLAEKRNLLLAGGDYPEVFYASAFPRADLLKYGKQGAFIPLNDLIDKYAPNFKVLMEKYPVIEKGITMPDGNIYGLPMLFDPEFKSVFYATPWVKEEWLDKLGISEPHTLDDFYNMLKAFKEEDPNGNGQKDEYAWGGVGTAGLVNYLRGTFGLNYNGTSNINVDRDPKSGMIRFIPSDPRYKELLQYVNKLYKDGLLEQDIMSVKSTEVDAKGMEGLLGVVNSVDPVAIYNQKGYVGLPVLKGPYGDQMYSAIGSPLGNIGMFVLTDKAKNPEAMIR